MILVALAALLLSADEDGGVKKHGTHCKALDENASVVLEHDCDGQGCIAPGDWGPASLYQDQLMWAAN